MDILTPNKRNVSMMTCAPQSGHTYLTIGQDLFSIEEYLREQYNYTLHQESPPLALESYIPAAFMFYTDIQTLRGLESPTDYGSGVEFAGGLKASNLQIGLWLNGTEGCEDIIVGKMDSQIQKLYDYLQSTGHQIFLRVGYEFDNPWFGYSSNPESFRVAFRKMVESSLHRSDRIQFVWHSWAAGVPSPHELQDFYPGDDVVDWIGISLFSQFYENETLGNRETVESVLAFAKVHQKPVMIAESTPFGGIPQMEDPWELWFESVLQLIEEHDIAMWSYINCNWEEQPMWKGVGFGDTRLSVNKTVQRLWHERVLHSPRFLQTVDCSRGGQQNEKQLEDLASSFVVIAAVLAFAVIVVSSFIYGLRRKFGRACEAYFPRLLWSRRDSEGELLPRPIIHGYNAVEVEE